MSSALRGVLSVHERVIFFAILTSVGHCKFNIFAVKVNYWINSFRTHIFVQQIEQSVSRIEFLSVVNNCQTSVQIHIVFQHCFDIFGNKAVMSKNFDIGRKRNKNSVLFFGWRKWRIYNQMSLRKSYHFYFVFTM